MRIIAGTARGRRLQEFTGRDIRPTSDRVREALFSMLLSRLDTLAGCRVLDLFAGTGALGLEALSRGAEAAWFVEREPQAAALVAANINHCGFAAKGHLRQADVLEVLRTAPLPRPFDLIFADPPYGRELLPACLERIESGGWLAEHGILCAEAAATDPVPEAVGRLRRLRERRYGQTTLFLFHLDPEETADP